MNPGMRESPSISTCLVISSGSDLFPLDASSLLAVPRDTLTHTHTDVFVYS